MNAVIDEASFDKIMGYIEYAKKSSDAEVVFGGKGDKSTGYFIEPPSFLPRIHILKHGGRDFRTGHVNLRL